MSATPFVGAERPKEDGRNPYAGERCIRASSCGEGFAMVSLEEQAERLSRVLGLEPDWLKWPGKAYQRLPDTRLKIDGLGLLPSLAALGKLWDIPNPRGSGYGRLIAAVCDRIDKSPEMPPLDRCEGIEEAVDADGIVTTPDSVRIASGTVHILSLMEGAGVRTGCNCFIAPVNLGVLDDSSRSPRHALWQTLHWKPEGLAMEAVGGLALLIGNPQRLNREGQLAMDLPGTEYWGDGRWTRSLSIRFYAGELQLYTRLASCPEGACGFAFALPGIPTRLSGCLAP